MIIISSQSISRIEIVKTNAVILFKCKKIHACSFND